MKKIKFGNLQKLIAILILAVIIVLVVGIAVSGSSEIGNNGGIVQPPKNEGENESDAPDEKADKPPEYINYLTGLETTEEDNLLAYSFVLYSDALLYGVSRSELVFEIPCENGQTRFVVYDTDVEGTAKIGSLAPTRKYINSITSSFGGIITSYGNDDVFEYSANDAEYFIDVTHSQESYYKEGAKNVYTNADLIASVRDKYQISEQISASLPYDFADFGEKVSGITSAKSITLEYEGNETELVFDESLDKYLLYKRGDAKTDMLNGEYISFSNVLVLFADATTYEKSNGTETVIDMASGGKGYYATSGMLTEINWKTDSEGKMTLFTLDGNRLTVNRGTSYFGFFKSSGLDNVEFK